MHTKHLPIADPCHEDWNAMDRVERGRFCQVCVKQVYDLSSMTERQATRLLRDTAGTRICVRYRHDDEGQIRFAPLTPPAATCRSPRRLAWAGAVAMAATMAACTPHDNPDVTKTRATPVTVEPVPMGALQLPPEPERQLEDQELKGELVAIEPPPQFTQGEPPIIPERELKGDVAVTPPSPRLGRGPAPKAEPTPPEPVEPEPLQERLGDVEAPPAPTTPAPPDPREVGVLGQLAAPTDHSPFALLDEPCDGPNPKR